MRRLLVEAGQALAIIAGFAGLGLALSLGAARALERPSPYLAEAMALAETVDPDVWLVDGFNVLHAVVLKGRDRADWWRAPARERVVMLAKGLADQGREVWVVFDGDDDPQDDDSGVRQVFAPSADDWLVHRVKQLRQDGDPGVAVVTSDRQLADRVRHHGATVVSPTHFHRRCQSS